MDFHKMLQNHSNSNEVLIIYNKNQKMERLYQISFKSWPKKAKFFTSNNIITLIILVVWTKYEQIHERHVGISTPQLNTDIITALEFLVCTYRGKNTYFID